jgi:DNA-binding transcriptional LysR family regulator
MYDPVLLRTFLVVADARSFTAAGAQLGISQPTVSQHIRRLEDSVGRGLVVRDTREVRLTDAGDALAGFARTILAAHAAAERYFDTAPTKGRIRFGVADDLAATQLPGILRQFRQLNPHVTIELSVDQSAPLARRLAAGHLDLVMVKQPSTETGEGTLVLRDALVWVALESTRLEQDEPVPLVTYRAPSFSRSAAIDALEADGRPWRITCAVRDVGAMHAAVRAGLGLAVFAHSLIPGDLVKVSNRFELPTLGPMDFRLLENPAAPNEAVGALKSAILSRRIGPTPQV